MNFILNVGEFFDSRTNTVWIELTRIEPCSELGCCRAALYELYRTVIPGTIAALDFRCDNHAPLFITGNGGLIIIPPATGGLVGRRATATVMDEAADAADIVIPSLFGPAAVVECSDCWNTGYYHGFGAPCKLGCKPGKRA